MVSAMNDGEKLNPENAPVNDDHVEGFVAGTILARDTERDRIFEGVVALPPLNVDFVEYIRLDDVLKLIKRPI